MDIENTAIRLKKIMEIRHLKQVDLLELVKPYCEKYNVKMNKSDISQYLSGKTKPNQDKLVILSMALNVSEPWLIGYDVPMNRTSTVSKLDVTQDEITLLNNYNKLNSKGKEKLLDYSDDLTNNIKYMQFDDISNSNDLEFNTIAAHDDNLTEEEKENSFVAALECIKKHNK